MQVWLQILVEQDESELETGPIVRPKSGPNPKIQARTRPDPDIYFVAGLRPEI